MADPWFKFYPTDWGADPQLRMCSLAARGLWIEMICLMHKANPYGHLLVSGQSPTDAQLAVLVGTQPDQIPELLGELEAAGVFSRTRKHVIYSRKMARAVKRSAIAQQNGRKGGNPTLSKQKENSAQVNPKDKGRHKPQKPEARSQKEEVSKATSSYEAAADYSDYLEAHPKPVESATGEARWDALIASGVDPAQVVASARAYAAKVAGFSSVGMVQQSDNFLDHDRGKWRENIPVAAGPKATDAEVLDFYAETVLKKKATAPKISPQIAKQLVDAGRVTPDDLRAAGVSA